MFSAEPFVECFGYIVDADGNKFQVANQDNTDVDWDATTAQMKAYYDTLPEADRKRLAPWGMYEEPSNG